MKYSISKAILLITSSVLVGCCLSACAPSSDMTDSLKSTSPSETPSPNAAVATPSASAPSTEPVHDAQVGVLEVLTLGLQYEEAVAWLDENDNSYTEESIQEGYNSSRTLKTVCDGREYSLCFVISPELATAPVYELASIRFSLPANECTDDFSAWESWEDDAGEKQYEKNVDGIYTSYRPHSDGSVEQWISYYPIGNMPVYYYENRYPSTFADIFPLHIKVFDNGVWASIETSMPMVLLEEEISSLGDEYAAAVKASADNFSENNGSVYETAEGGFRYYIEAYSGAASLELNGLEYTINDLRMETYEDIRLLMGYPTAISFSQADGYKIEYEGMDDSERYQAIFLLNTDLSLRDRVEIRFY